MNPKMNAGSIWYSVAKDAYLELVEFLAGHASYRYAGEDAIRRCDSGEFLRNFSRV